jgi:hypothetical protein
MTGQLNHLIALERSRDLHRNAEKHRAAIISSAPTAKNPAVLRVQRLGGWWRLHRRLRAA